jgi:hypothetical protein
MAWVRMDDKRALNAKLRKAGFAARGLDEAAICWSAHEEQDGFISEDDVNMLASLHGCRKPQPLVESLVGVRRWRRDERKSGWWITNFLDFNPSRADIDIQRAQKQEAGRRGGIRSGVVRSKQSTSEASASTKTEAGG